MTVLDTTFITEDDLLDQENSLEIIERLRASNDWEEVEAYRYLNDSAREHSLTATTLRGKNLIERRPIKFYNKKKTSCTMIFHLGENL